MSEYMEIETELSDDEMVMNVYTNLKLAEGDPEHYDSLTAMEEGSPVAQALAMITGITAVTIEGSDMLIRKETDTDWHIIVADVSAALKDFFL